MQRSFIRQAQYGLEHDSPVAPPHPRQRVGYASFRSKYGPAYKIGPHIFGIDSRKGLRYATLLGAFGATAGIFAVFFLGGVPRVKKDILQKLPLIGDYFVHEIPPEDNPF